MSLECLKVDLACTIIRLSQTNVDPLPLVDQVAPYLDQNTHLIIDLEGIDLTSMEIGELVNLADAFHKVWDGKACYMAVVNLTSAAQSIFAVTKLDRVFTCFDTISSALNHFTSQGLGNIRVAQ